MSETRQDALNAPTNDATNAVTHVTTLRPDGAAAGGPAPMLAAAATGLSPARVHDVLAPTQSPERPRSDDDAYTLPPAALPVVERLRARPGTLLVVGPQAAGPRLAVRVEVPEVWDVVALDAAAGATVAEVKRAALGLLLSGTAVVEEYVVKLNGATVLDERASIAAVGARDGSIFLVTHRRRRPVR